MIAVAAVTEMGPVFAVMVRVGALVAMIAVTGRVVIGVRSVPAVMAGMVGMDDRRTVVGMFVVPGVHGMVGMAGMFGVRHVRGGPAGPTRSLVPFMMLMVVVPRGLRLIISVGRGGLTVMFVAVAVHLVILMRVARRVGSHALAPMASMGPGRVNCFAVAFLGVNRLSVVVLTMFVVHFESFGLGYLSILRDAVKQAGRSCREYPAKLPPIDVWRHQRWVMS